MKKSLTILLIMAASIKGYTQAFVGIHGNSLGVGVHAGVESNCIAFTAGFNNPLLSSTTPRLFYSTVGYVYKFSEDDPFSVSLHAGVAYSKAKVVSKDYGTVLPVNKFVGMGNIEVGKQWHTGVLFVNAGYTGKLYYGLGIKCFLN